MYVYYDRILQKTIPCTLRENFIEEKESEIGTRFYVRVSYDFASFATFTVSRDEVYRYSSEVRLINDIYPYTTQAEIDYYNAVFPNKVVTPKEDHALKELERFETIITDLIGNVVEISLQVLYSLSKLISWELMFMYCDYDDRVMLQTCGNVLINYIPLDLSHRFMAVARMSRLVTSKRLSNGVSPRFKIMNIRHFSEYLYIEYPLVIVTDYFYDSISYIIDNIPLVYVYRTTLILTEGIL